MLKVSLLVSLLALHDATRFSLYGRPKGKT